MTSDWARPFYKNKSVVVSGSTSGIGFALAGAFAAAGARVHATGATETEVEAARAATSDIVFSVLDVRDTAAVNDFAARFETVAALVNCAGVNLRAAEFTPEGFETVLDINLSGTMRMCTALRPQLRGGAVLNIASMFAFFGAGHATAYAASKGGVAQLTKSTGGRLGEGAGAGERAGPGLDRDGDDHSAPRQSGTQCRTGRPHADGPLGQARGPGGAGAVPVLAARRFRHGTVLPVDGGYLVA